MSDVAFRVLRRSSGRLRVTVPTDAGRLSALEDVSGVSEVRFNEWTANALITFDPQVIDEDQILARLAVIPEYSAAPPLRSASRQASGRHPDRRRAAAKLPLPGLWGAQASVVVDAPPSRCLATLLDCESYPDWQRYVTRAEVLERDAQSRPALVRTCAKVAGRSVRHTLRYDYPSPGRVAWEQCDGALGAVRGEWRLRRLGPARTRVSYRLELLLEGGLYRLVRGPAFERMGDILLAETLDGLRLRAEA
jgi:ribosome-associated toxin RatA of RatAB toxin-antitoxin module